MIIKVRTFSRHLMLLLISLSKLLLKIYTIKKELSLISKLATQTRFDAHNIYMMLIRYWSTLIMFFHSIKTVQFNDVNKVAISMKHCSLDISLKTG